MPTIIVFVRILICFALICAPLLLYIVASRKPENALWLIFPMFGGIPAILGALFIFVPLEAFLQAHALGHLKNVAVPLSGSLLILIFMVVAGVVSGNGPKMFRQMIRADRVMISATLFWSILGVAWGVSWRLSDGVVRWIGLLGGPSVL